MATFESREFEEREERFIVGVFNYCDRWCEKCRFNDRCRVYDSERALMERHELLGEDPDDPAVMLQDVSDTFDHTMTMLQEMADEMGVEFEDEDEDEGKLDDEPDMPVRHLLDDVPRHPLCLRADQWMERVVPLLDQVREEIPKLGEEMAGTLFTLDDEAKVEQRGHEILGSVNEVRDAYELLCRYRYFIVVKIRRALSSVEEADEEDPDMARIDRDDARGTAKLLDECIGRAVKALWTLAEFHRPWFDTAVPLATEGESIRRDLAEAVPNFHLFHRPGFDDYPEEAES